MKNLLKRIWRLIIRLFMKHSMFLTFGHHPNNLGDVQEHHRWHGFGKEIRLVKRMRA